VPATIEQLASDAVNTEDPETALRALSALRIELEGLEPLLVSRALRAGATWSQIARSLGVSKQAAHRKHRHLSAHAAVSDAEPSVQITSEARRSVQLARQEARRLGQPALGTEHLLLGILRCDDSHAVRALNALGVTHQQALDALQPTMAAAPAQATGDDDVSRPARRILEGAVRASLGRGDGYIGVEHLLLALLADSRNGAVQTLEALRVNPGRVRRQLEQEWLAAGRPEG
jgi:transposase-like protein